ncbi:hypothetical protein [Candidatus Lokiarchaeum ossiferum]|uniref:hypothetical protein n=1 Tax=Candidatus Lokiarchaeum ossiferum TaxID=2951803 RepID=UPI00352EAF7E
MNEIVKSYQSNGIHLEEHSFELDSDQMPINRTVLHSQPFNYSDFNYLKEGHTWEELELRNNPPEVQLMEVSQ